MAIPAGYIRLWFVHPCHIQTEQASGMCPRVALHREHSVLELGELIQDAGPIAGIAGITESLEQATERRVGGKVRFAGTTRSPR